MPALAGVALNTLAWPQVSLILLAVVIPNGFPPKCAARLYKQQKKAGRKARFLSVVSVSRAGLEIDLDCDTFFNRQINHA